MHAENASARARGQVGPRILMLGCAGRAPVLLILSMQLDVHQMSITMHKAYVSYDVLATCRLPPANLPVSLELCPLAGGCQLPVQRAPPVYYSS